MRICFWGKIADALLGKTYGGGELQIALLAKSLTRLGHEVVVVDLDIKEGFVTDEGIKVYPVIGYNSGMKMFRTLTHRLPALYSTFAGLKADVYYCRIREYRHIIVYMVARKLKAKFILSLASDLDILSIRKRWKHFYSSNVKDLWGVFNGVMGEMVYPYLLRNADLVLVQHEGQKLIDYVRQDLIQSCKYVANEGDIGVPVVNRAGDTWSFCKFNSEFASSGSEAGQPIPEKVSYEFERSSGIIYRNVMRAAVSSLAKSERLVIARKVIDFSINPYTLNGLKYFQIKAKVGVAEAETHVRGEELVLVTSVESRFDNNYIKQKGWNDNRQTKLFKW